MIAPDLPTAIAQLHDLIENAECVLPFTGAGISTECGIPDFRSPGGLWTQNRPINFDDFLASRGMREESWKRRFDAGHSLDCACGGFIKTATVSFGQAMPEDAMSRAEELTKRCDVFLAVGSSLVVWPAAGFPLMAKRNGAALVIVNREPTEFDEIADLTVRYDIGDVFAPFISH